MAVLGCIVYWGHDCHSECVELGVSDLAGGVDAAAVGAGGAAEFWGRYLRAWHMSRDVISVCACDFSGCDECNV